MEVSRPAITRQIILLRNLGYIEVIKKGQRNNHSNTMKVLFNESQPIVDELEETNFDGQKKVMDMISKAFNMPAQVQPPMTGQRKESPTVKAMKEQIRMLKKQAT
jgi:hypothetical protein